VVSGTIRSTIVEGLGGVAVGGEIVTGEDGEGGDARSSPALKRRHDESRRRSRRVRMSEVVNDIGMLFVEFAGLRRVTIALLGDGQRDDARGGIGHARDQTCRVGGRDDDLKHRADNPVLGAGAGTNGYRIEAVLRDEGVACVRTSQAGADDAPIRCAPSEKVVDHDRLVRPVKGPDSKMNDARPDTRAVVIRAADLAREPGEAGVREAQMALYRVGMDEFRPLA
jgi:hypothetical protein